VLFWFVDRRRPLLLCSALSIALAIFYLLIAWRWLHNDPYDWLRRRYLAITVMMTLISVLHGWRTRIELHVGAIDRVESVSLV